MALDFYPSAQVSLRYLVTGVYKCFTEILQEEPGKRLTLKSEDGLSPGVHSWDCICGVGGSTLSVSRNCEHTDGYFSPPGPSHS